MASVHPTFSVATPAFQALEQLGRCVGSVRGQREVAVEHIVQDAASTDGTPAWLEAQPDLLWRSESDRGMYDAIERAWARANGDVLSWLNADEQYLPGTLRTIERIFEERPEIDILFGDYIVVDRDGLPIAQRREIPFRKPYVVNGFLNTASCTLFFRRRLYEQGLLKFDTSLRYAADADLMIRLHDRGVRAWHVPQYLSLFGIDGTNLSTHPARRIEADTLRRMHGALPHPLLRSALMLGRTVERAALGSYRRSVVQYRYAADATPTYLKVTSGRLGSRYALSQTRGSAASVERCEAC
jgi:glycosyltransferase involved in cell wall biosynthesis